MINACDQPLRFHVQEGQGGDWRRVVDTSLPSPQDLADPGAESALTSLDYEVAPRSVVVLTRGASAKTDRQPVPAPKPSRQQTRHSRKSR